MNLIAKYIFLRFSFYGKLYFLKIDIQFYEIFTALTSTAIPAFLTVLMLELDETPLDVLIFIIYCSYTKQLKGKGCWLTCL